MLSGFGAFAFGGPGTTVLDIVGSSADNIKIIEFLPGKMELEIIGGTASNITIAPYAGKSYDSLNCNDGNPCTIDSCGPKGCVHIPVNCDDSNPCTIDLCDANGCVHIPVNCDKGDLWNTDYCLSCPTHLSPGAKYVDQWKTYPWDHMHLGVDAWYGAFWYKNIYMPKWPQI